MTIVVWPGDGANELATRLSAALGGETIVVNDDLTGSEAVVVTSANDEAIVRAPNQTTILFGSSEHGRAYWLERDVEWVPPQHFDELVARCRRLRRTPAPTAVRERDDWLTASPMSPQKVTQATFQIVEQVCPDALVGLYRNDDGEGLELFQASVPDVLPPNLNGTMPNQPITARPDNDSCELCGRSAKPLVGENGACYLAAVESETRCYGMLVVCSPVELGQAPNDAIVNAARQLAYGLEASHLFSQVRRAYGSLRETKDQLVHAEKFAAVGLLAAEIAHEINNPASFVITNLSVLGDYAETVGEFHEAVRQAATTGLDGRKLSALEDTYEIRYLEEDVEALIRRSLAGLGRIHQIVQDLRFTSNARSTSSGWVSVERLIEASIGLVRHEAKFRADIQLDFSGVPMVKSDPNRLSQVFLNLLVNAVQAIPPGEMDANMVKVSTMHRAGEVEVAVCDTGVGIAEKDRDRIFEPFFTTKAPGDGTGLGLSISRDVIRALGGDLSFESEVGVGTTFKVVLPVSDGPDP